MLPQDVKEKMLEAAEELDDGRVQCPKCSFQAKSKPGLISHYHHNHGQTFGVTKGQHNWRPLRNGNYAERQCVEKGYAVICEDCGELGSRENGRIHYDDDCRGS